MQPRLSFRLLSRADAWLNRVYTSQFNPLYHSGAIAMAMLLVLLVSGLYLLLFYRVGAPYESVVHIADGVPAGGWVRGVHRFASDACLVAALVHAFRMYAQRRVWGPRALAWVSGVGLVAVVLISGWTGYVLVWDEHARVIAVEGARWLDALPILSEPIGRSFTGESAVPAAFFFLNLFAHIALPIGMGALVWVHVARVARPVLLPARPVLWGSMAALGILAALWPPPLPPAADPLVVPRQVPLDWFFGFWLPLSQRLPAGAVWALIIAVPALAAAIPWILRPRTEALPAPAVVNERSCTGCEQCVRDCPYDAIEMRPRTDGRRGQVAFVTADLCTSCGICIGSCPPMAIGPLGVTGRSQVSDVRAFLDTHRPTASDVVMVGCSWSAARAQAERTGALFMSVPCIGTLHTSAVEILLRGGAGGVLVVGCPEHDGRTREGVTWAEDRLFSGRPADLKARVDRNRVRLVQATIGEGALLHEAARAFSEDIRRLAAAAADEIDLVDICRKLQPTSPAEDR